MDLRAASIRVEAAGGAARLVITLTDSRTAGALGRVCALDALRARHTVWQRWGFRIADGHQPPIAVLRAAAYVGDLYSIGPTAGCVAAILDDCAAHLVSNWGSGQGREQVNGCGPRSVRMATSIQGGQRGLRCRSWVTLSLPTGARLCVSNAP